MAAYTSLPMICQNLQLASSNDSCHLTTVTELYAFWKDCCLLLTFILLYLDPMHKLPSVQVISFTISVLKAILYANLNQTVDLSCFVHYSRKEIWWISSISFFTGQLLFLSPS